MDIPYFRDDNRSVVIDGQYFYDHLDFTVPYLTVLCLVSILGTFGNTLIIIAVLTSKNLRTAANMFIVNLAVADICVSSFVDIFSIIGGIPVTVYKPSNCPKNPSILVYFHGGGLVIGSRKTTEAACISIARDAPCVCVNVEYRLAPEHKIPAMNNDAKCVLTYVMKNKSMFGGTELSTVGVGGDSAGGGISAHVCHDVPGISYQILVYPSVDKTMKQQSFEEFRADLIIPRPFLDWFFAMQFSDPSIDKSDPKISALYRPSFKNLPPALVILAEIDPLRDCGKEYYEKLKAAGVEAECCVFEGVTHAFYGMPGVFKENCKRAYQKTLEFINKFQTNGTVPSDSGSKI